MEMAKSREKLKDFAALCLWLISSLVMAIASFVLYREDFRGYYAAARVLLVGGNPYDYNQLAPILLQITGRMGNNPYYYPPWFAWFITPFAVLPYGLASVLWMALNWTVWLYSLWMLGKYLNWPKEGWRRWLIFFLATYLFAWITWRYEQTGILLFAFLVAILVALDKKDWLGVGIWMALFLLKPNITLVPLVAIIIWLLRCKQWKPIIIFGLTVAFLLAATTLATPDWYQPLFKPGIGNGLANELNGPGQIVAIRINTTLTDFLKMSHLNATIIALIYIVAFLIGILVLAFTLFHFQSILEIIAISLLVGYALTPYALQYDYPPLTFVLLWALAVCFGSVNKIRHWAALLITAFILSVPLWERPISDAYIIVIALIGLVLFCRKPTRHWDPQQGFGEVGLQNADTNNYSNQSRKQ